MSYDGLFQLGMGAVLLKASQTEDTNRYGVLTRRALSPCYRGRLGAPAGRARWSQPDPDRHTPDLQGFALRKPVNARRFKANAARRKTPGA